MARPSARGRRVASTATTSAPAAATARASSSVGVMRTPSGPWRLCSPTTGSVTAPGSRPRRRRPRPGWPRRRRPPRPAPSRPCAPGRAGGCRARPAPTPPGRPGCASSTLTPRPATARPARAPGPSARPAAPRRPASRPRRARSACRGGAAPRRRRTASVSAGPARNTLPVHDSVAGTSRCEHPVQRRAAGQGELTAGLGQDLQRGGIAAARPRAPPRPRSPRGRGWGDRRGSAAAAAGPAGRSAWPRRRPAPRSPPRPSCRRSALSTPARPMAKPLPASPSSEPVPSTLAQRGAVVGHGHGAGARRPRRRPGGPRARRAARSRRRWRWSPAPRPRRSRMSVGDPLQVGLGGDLEPRQPQPDRRRARRPGRPSSSMASQRRRRPPCRARPPGSPSAARRVRCPRAGRPRCRWGRGRPAPASGRRRRPASGGLTSRRPPCTPARTSWCRWPRPSRNPSLTTVDCTLSGWMAIVSSSTDGTFSLPLSTFSLARSPGASLPWASGTASSAAEPARSFSGW